MIIVLASRHDCAARELADAWSERAEVALMCPGDLSTEGWRVYTHGEQPSAAVAEGRPIMEDRITGVLTLLPCVFDSDLLQIAPEERRYVATEMQAFLIYWLSRLRCPVMNRPSATSLAGPNWGQEQWHLAAARIGIPVRRTIIRSPSDPAAHESDIRADSVIVVGDRLLGANSAMLRERARLLARSAGVELLEVYFARGDPVATYLGATPWPDFTRAEVSDAIFASLGG